MPLFLNSYTVQQLQQQVRRLRQLVLPGALILLYHRVAEQAVDPWDLGVTPAHFAEHLAILRHYAHPMSLPQLVQAHQERTLPPRAVAITFDDGYGNNLHGAKPLLEQYDMPATVFISTGPVQAHREFWWDELDQVVLQCQPLPPQLVLEVNGTPRQWTLDAATTYSSAEHHADVQRVRRDPPPSPSPRLAFYYSLWKYLFHLPEPQRQQALTQINAWAQVDPVPRASHRPLHPQECHVLEAGGLITVGAHTIHHPILSEQSLGGQRHEIQQGKADLETMLNHPVTSFSYPFGAYSQATLPLVREAGFDYACSTIVETTWRYSDRFQLPRVEAKDWDGEEFMRQLWPWLRCH